MLLRFAPVARDWIAVTAALRLSLFIVSTSDDLVTFLMAHGGCKTILSLSCSPRNATVSGGII